LRVRLEPWGKDDLPLLRRLLGDPAMMVHLGGPETEEQIVERQARYEQIEHDQGRVFKVVEEGSGEAAGWVGYWERSWRDQEVWEVGWSVLLEFQGRGVGRAATALAIESAQSDGKHRFMHAFPAVDNGPSNAICRKLGFELLGEHEFEYPKDNLLLCNDWRLDLDAKRL
jgi:RimJ/RimL family protein N-acetyltransferase